MKSFDNTHAIIPVNDKIIPDWITKKLNEEEVG